MKRYEEIKKQINECDSAMELAGCLEGVRVAASLYCKGNYPDEVIFEKGKLEDVSIYGMKDYLESEVIE